MGTIYLPPKIEIVEQAAPEFYADGASFIDRGDVMTGIYYVERMLRGRAANVEVLRVHYGRDRWLTNLERVVAAIRKSGH